MKTEFRRDLAQRPFEEKIRMVGELIRLCRNAKAQHVSEPAENYLQSDFGTRLLPKPDVPRE
jgi:SOS response regulatory protein OraA/RecX